MALYDSQRLSGNAVYDSQQYEAGSGLQTLSPGLFTNDNAFYAPIVSLAGGSQSLTQSSRFDNANSFYPASVSGGAVSLPASTGGGGGGIYYQDQPKRKIKKNRVRQIIDDAVDEYLEDKKPKASIKKSLKEAVKTDIVGAPISQAVEVIDLQAEKALLHDIIQAHEEEDLNDIATYLELEKNFVIELLIKIRGIIAKVSI